MKSWLLDYLLFITTKAIRRPPIMSAKYTDIIYNYHLLVEQPPSLSRVLSSLLTRSVFAKEPSFL